MSTKVKTVYDDITYKIIGAAMAVHNELGPGFPEEFYQKALALEMSGRALSYEAEKSIEVVYQGTTIGLFYLDFLVEDAVVVETKALGQLTTLHQEQTISYLVAAGREVALLINFGGLSLEHRRIIPPSNVQKSESYKRRVLEWKRKWPQRGQPIGSAD